MRYSKAQTQELLDLYAAGVPADAIALQLNTPKRSVISKLSSLGVYQRAPYVNKRGETPVSKAEYIERIAELVDCSSDLLESLEKANKSVLVLLERALR